MTENQSKPTILYIDDEDANLRAFKSVFRREFNILTANSGKEGLEIFDKETCHLIITDQYMPNMTGIEFLKRIAEIIPKKIPKRIILSGFSEPKDIKEARDKYFLHSFVSKPWDSNEMREIILSAIDTIGENE